MSDIKGFGPAHDCVIVGSKCHAKHSYTILIGMGLVSDQPYQLKVGNTLNHVTAVIPPESFRAIADAIIDGVNHHA